MSVQEIEAPMDPTKKLSRLVSEYKYDEAFTAALQRIDISIILVMLLGIFCMHTIKLNRYVKY